MVSLVARGGGVGAGAGLRGRRAGIVQSACWLAGPLAALAVTVMHYLGMYSMRFYGYLRLGLADRRAVGGDR